MFSLYITSTSEGDYLCAKGLRSLKVSKIAEFMNINLHIETPHESIPGVTVGKLGGPLYELVKLIEGVLNETGQILEDGGYRNLGQFVAETLNESQKGRTASGDDDAVVDFILEKV